MCISSKSLHKPNIGVLINIFFAGNNPPVFSNLNSSLTLFLNCTSNLTLNATDPEGDNVTYQLTGNSTDAATIDTATNTLSITPAGNPFYITVLASDSTGLSSSWQPNVYVCDCLNGGSCDFSYASDTFAESNSGGFLNTYTTFIWFNYGFRQATVWTVKQLVTELTTLFIDIKKEIHLWIVLPD
jgi:hypothetical protein